MSPPQYQELKINAPLARIFTDFYPNWSDSVPICMIFSLVNRLIIIMFKVKDHRLVFHRLLGKSTGLSKVKSPCWILRRVMPIQDGMCNNEPSNQIVIDLVKGQNVLQFGMRVLCGSSSILTRPLSGLITTVLTFKKLRTHEASEPKCEFYTSIYWVECKLSLAFSFSDTKF